MLSHELIKTWLISSILGSEHLKDQCHGFWSKISENNLEKPEFFQKVCIANETLIPDNFYWAILAQNASHKHLKVSFKFAGCLQLQWTDVIYCNNRCKKEMVDVGRWARKHEHLVSIPLPQWQKDHKTPTVWLVFAEHELHSSSRIQTTQTENIKPWEKVTRCMVTKQGQLSENLSSDAKGVRRKIPICPSEQSNDRHIHWRVSSITEHSNAIKLHGFPWEVVGGTPYDTVMPKRCLQKCSK